MINSHRGIQKRIAVKLLSKKLRELTPVEITVEEVSVLTKQHGEQVSFTLITNIMMGRAVNPARKKIVALAKALNTPFRYLADDSIHTPLEAVLADIECLQETDVLKLITRLSSH
jgi:transcriptional regulator with XRE-family HTH domain